MLKNNLEGQCEYKIKFGDYTYTYYLYHDFDGEFLTPLKELQGIDNFIIICDKTIKQLYARQICEIIGDNRCQVVSFEGGEENKNLSVISELVEEILGRGVTRSTCIVGLGGGLVGNMAGMVAAMLFRGLKLVHIPTSLMAILDSVLSLKQAINSKYGKNLIGFFYKPEMVLTSLKFFESLPKEHIIAGLCEVVKNSVAIQPGDINTLEKIANPKCEYLPEDYQFFIDRSIKSKIKVMQNDAFEKNDGIVLEYGHTIGHAIELASKGKVIHGQAVGLGMICAAELSRRLGYLSKEHVELHIRLLERIGSITKLPEDIKVKNIIPVVRFDNKRGFTQKEKNVHHLVLLKDLGVPLRENGKYLIPVPEKFIESVIEDMIIG